MSLQANEFIYKSFPISNLRDFWILSHEFYPNASQRILLEETIRLQMQRISDYKKRIRLNEGDGAALHTDRDNLCAILEANCSLLAPIRKLSNACLLIIFSYLPVYPIIVTYRVCRRWMLMCKKTPWLWGEIRLEPQRIMPYKAIAKHILNSKEGFLYLDLDVRRYLATYDVFATCPPFSYSVLQILQACRGRFRTLRIIGSDGVDWLFFTQSSMSFPHLASLTIDYEEANNSLMDLQLERLPCLEELRFIHPGSLLKHIRFPVMSSLRVIVINDWCFDQNALEMVRMAPNLIQLHLSLFSKMSEEDERCCSIVPMILPSLEEFEFIWLGPSTSLIPKTFLSVLKTGDCLERVALDLDSSFLYQTFSNFPEYPHAVTQLRIEVKLGENHSTDRLNPFDTLSRKFFAVSSLEIYSNLPTSEGAEGILRGLYPRCNGYVPFMFLKELRLVDVSIDESLANLIEARHMLPGGYPFEVVDLDHCRLDHITLAALWEVEERTGVAIEGLADLQEIPET